MNICIPIDEDKGLQSAVCAHFGSAPAFMIVDTGSGNYRAIPNGNQHHGHARCTPLQSLRGEQIGGVVVGGIGMGALNDLNAQNILVYASDQATIGVTLAAFEAGTLQLIQPSMTCSSHCRP